MKWRRHDAFSRWRAKTDFRVHSDTPLTTYVLNLCHDIFPKSTSYILCCLFLFITIKHTPLTNIPTPGEVWPPPPWQFCSALCVSRGGGWKDVASDVG